MRRSSSPAPVVVVLAIVLLLLPRPAGRLDRVVVPVNDGQALPPAGLEVNPVPPALPDQSAPDSAPVPAPAPPGPAAVLEIAYRVEVRSDDPALADAAAVIEATLEDPRGWQQAAIDFQRRDDAPFVIVIAEGAEAQVLCLPYDVGGRFSCQNGPLVVLNAIRWREAVPHWPQVGTAAGLATYRQMLVNHEVGHLLGMHHIRCRTAGGVAPVMEQQSGTLRGCTANAWPTSVELALAATHQFEIAPPPRDVPFPP